MVGESRRRVVVVFETHWDRKQLEACREAWDDRVELAFPEPDDVACPSDFDVLGFVEAAASAGLGRMDGVLSSSDYPGATVAAAIATRIGLAGSRPECVLRASHKYESRLVQQRVAPDAVPGFALVDPAGRGVPPPLPFPFFLKPVKGAFSVLARRIESPEALAAFLASPAVGEFTGEYMAIFDRLIRAFTDFESDGGYFIAEELITGQLATVEGFVCEGRVELLGIVDSGVDAGTGSFARFDYPSQLPERVQWRMRDVADRVVRALELDRTLFNIEMTWQPETDAVRILEVNPRLCGQFADLYQKVDGRSSYEVALALCLGEQPQRLRSTGRFAAAASFPLRVFEPCRVVESPDAATLARIERDTPGALLWSECAAGDALADFDVDEDGASHRYAVVNLGGAGRDELDDRLAALRVALGYRMQPLVP